MDADSKAIRAEQLLQDELLTEVLDAIEAAAVNAWRSTKTGESLEREIAWYSIKAAERVRATLRGIVDNGLIEANRSVRLASSRP